MGSAAKVWLPTKIDVFYKGTARRHNREGAIWRGALRTFRGDQGGEAGMRTCAHPLQHIRAMYHPTAGGIPHRR